MTRMRARLVLALVVAATVVVVPFLARARHVDVTDKNDVRGLLDIRRVHTFGSEKPGFKVYTYNSWTNRGIFERGFVLVFIDVRGTKRSDYYALARSTPTRVVATLYRDRQYKRDRKVGSVRVWRASSRSITFQVPLRKMNFGPTRRVYRWYVETLFTGRRCRRVCFDFAPNRDVVTEPRPGATPSPTTASG
jgi:hypothetical protein